MKNLKKNNKGFSLVELIVVVLIIAIIAVALAPQVMKWVGEAQTSTDKNNIATLKSAISVAVAEAQKDGVTVTLTDVTINADSFGSATPAEGAAKTINNYIAEVLNGDYCGGTYKVTITASGLVKVEKVTT